MDIYCPKCAEPVEIDYLHDVAAEHETDFAAVLRDFQRRGCPAVDYGHNTDTLGSGRAAAASALYDLLGDDVDGATAMLEDGAYLGLF